MARRTVKIIGLLGILLIAFSIPLPVLMSSSPEEEKPAATAPPAPPPPLVIVGAVEPGTVPLAFEFAGRIGASRDVEIRARVSGVLLERAFEELAPVKQGDVLFRIDPAPTRPNLPAHRRSFSRRRPA
jgi:membrane fusion protein, multidrug efflux system